MEGAASGSERPWQPEGLTVRAYDGPLVLMQLQCHVPLPYDIDPVISVGTLFIFCCYVPVGNERTYFPIRGLRGYQDQSLALYV